MRVQIEDDETVRLVGDLARRLGVTTADAVKSAVLAALDRLVEDTSFETRLAAFYARRPLPNPTGLAADKSFYDALSGESD